MSDFNKTNNNHHSTLISFSALIVNALEFCGHDYRPIIATAGFDADTIYVSTERVSGAFLEDPGH